MAELELQPIQVFSLSPLSSQSLRLQLLIAQLHWLEGFNTFEHAGPCRLFFFLLFLVCSLYDKLSNQNVDSNYKGSYTFKRKKKGRSKRMTENDTDNNSATTRIIYYSIHTENCAKHVV